VVLPTVAASASFPPSLPLPLVAEAMAQAILLADPPPAGAPLRLLGLDQVVLRQPVEAGQRLEVEVHREARFGKLARYTCRMLAAGKLVAEGRITVGLASREESMELKRYAEGNVTVLEVAGNVKLGESAKQLAAEMERIFQETAGGLLLDVARIDYVDSTGIGELVGYLQKFTQAGRRIALLRPHQRLEALLKLTQLDKVFPIFWEREQALAYVAGS